MTALRLDPRLMLLLLGVLLVTLAIVVVLISTSGAHVIAQGLTPNAMYPGH